MPNKGNAGAKNPIVAIRFTAGDDNVEDVTSQLQPFGGGGGGGKTSDGHQSTSLSSSPSNTGGAGLIATDDSSWRKEFGGFFSRKRCGSTETLPTNAAAVTQSSASTGTGTPQPSPMSTMSTSTASESGGSVSSSSLGTWKLIKGKVSQAMEDITSAKSNHSSAAAGNQPPAPPVASSVPIAIPPVESAAGDDSDADSATINSSISDDFNEAAARTGGGRWTLHGDGSDSDADLLDISHDSDAYVMKKSFEALRSGSDKTAAAAAAATTTSIPSKRSSLLSKLGRRGAEAAEWPGALRRRHHRHKAERDEKKRQRTPPPPGEVEDETNIESGVEITEEMQLPMPPSSTTSCANASSATTATTSSAGHTISHDVIVVHGPAARRHVPSTIGDVDDTDTFADVLDDDDTAAISPKTHEAKPTTWTTIVVQHFRLIPNKRLILVYAVLFGMCCLWHVPAFVQGMLTCLALMSVTQSSWQLAQPHIARYVNDRVFGDSSAAAAGRRCGPERGVFVVPDYAAMGDLVEGQEEPVVVVEHQHQQKPVKSYEGWMSTTHTYDPCNFHPSLARSVFARLDGTTLRLSQPARGNRVPKRSVFGEPPAIDVPLVGHRYYELLGCTVGMCPPGLARKRHFSRKYPIQLVVKEGTAEAAAGGGGGLRLGSPARGGGGVPDEEDVAAAKETTADEERSFGDLIMFSDLQRLVNDQQAVAKTTAAAASAPPPPPPPSADDVHLMLFARTDREKEDWYRRFVAASRGLVEDRQPTPVADAAAAALASDMVFVHEDDCAAALAGTEVTADDASVAGASGSHSSNRSSVADDASEASAVAPAAPAAKRRSDSSADEVLLMSPSAARGPADYVRFMGHYQRACARTKRGFRPVAVAAAAAAAPMADKKRTRREQRKIQETADDLWRGVDRTLLTDAAHASTGGLLWANVLAGRVLFSCLNNAALIDHVQVLLQRKLSAIRLPGFMEEVRIAHVHLGDCPPLIHRVASPRVDERGTWIDADVTYEGLMHMTITTKLNLLRLRRQQADGAAGEGKNEVPAPDISPEATATTTTPVRKPVGPRRQLEALCDSDAESSGASSSDSEASYVQNNVKSLPDPGSSPAPAEPSGGGGGGSKKFLRIVDRIAASNLFQSAAEISYIQKAMENMSTAIKLRVELKGMVARCCVNLPPPPSDRVWLGFRGPPRLWLSATPALGDHTVDWSILTGAIESKLCEELTKYLVYPNMVDLIVPQLGAATYGDGL